MSHISVLLKEVIDYLNVEPGKKYIDSTVGGGGHTEAILLKGGEVLGIDQDPKSLEVAEKRLYACPAKYHTVLGSGEYHTVSPSRRYKLVCRNFSQLKKVASENGFTNTDGILMDLGFASFQIDNSSYGLSFGKSGPLDMRLDSTLGVTAADLVNTIPLAQLTSLFRKVGEEPKAHLIAKAIVEQRSITPFKTTQDLVDVIEKVSRRKFGDKKHAATKVFMALRIAVNSELENLIEALPQAFDLLNEGGRLAIISFHSGEDRIVKNYFREKANIGSALILTEKPIIPSNEEINDNPRSRSAKLRVLQKNVKKAPINAREER